MPTTKNQFTPGPLAAAGKRIYAGDDQTAPSVAKTYGVNAENYAAEIVRRWNAQPALFAALQKMLRLHYDTAKATGEGLEAVNQAEAALALAQKEN